MDEDVSSTIRALAKRWRDAGALLPGFALLAEGRPVDSHSLARAAGLPEDELIRKLDAVRSERDQQGRIIELFGMTLTPTHHTLSVATGVFHACCALWAHAIPRLLDTHVDVRSVDPLDGTIVEIGITPSGVRSRRPAAAMATLAVASDDEIAGDVCESFCRHVRHFSDRDEAVEFARAEPRRSVVEIEELDALAVEFTCAISDETRVNAGER